MRAWRDRSPSDRGLAFAMALRGLVGPARALRLARASLTAALDLSRALETITHPEARLGDLARAARQLRSVVTKGSVTP